MSAGSFQKGKGRARVLLGKLRAGKPSYQDLCFPSVTLVLGL